MVLDVIEHVMHVIHHVIDVITDQLQCITCCSLHDMTLHPATFHYMHVLAFMGHVMDVITCLTWQSLPLRSHYIQDVIHVITCPLHAPQDANETAEIQFRHCFANKVYQLQCTANCSQLHLEPWVTMI